MSKALIGLYPEALRQPLKSWSGGEGHCGRTMGTGFGESQVKAAMSLRGGYRSPGRGDDDGLEGTGRYLG